MAENLEKQGRVRRARQGDMMTKKEEDLRAELEELKHITEELREVKDRTIVDGDLCENCKKYAALAYRTAEKYYEMLVRAELIETMWYRRGGINCENIECDPRREVVELKGLLESLKRNLSDVIDTSFTPKKEDNSDN